MNIDAAMLYQFDGPHPSHETFAEAIGVDWMHFERGFETNRLSHNENSYLRRMYVGLQSQQYSLVIGEGSTTVQNLLIAGLNPETTTILIVQDETFLRVNDYVWRGLGSIATRTVDGAICVSSLTKSWMNEWFDVPTQIVHSPLNDERYIALDSIKTEYIINDSPTIVSLATVSDREPDWPKNMPALVEAMQGIGDLVLLGPGHERFEYSNKSHVQTPGHVTTADLKEYFATADLFILPSLADGFGVAATEAMRARVPTIVSKMTGARDIIEDIDNSLICGTNSSDIANSIKNVLSMSPRKRQEISDMEYERASKLTESNQQTAFREAVTNLLNESISSGR